MAKDSLEDWQEPYSEGNKMADMFVVFLIFVLIVALLLMYLMHLRIKQLDKELRDLRSRMALTDDELNRLAHDIDDFKRLKI